MGFVGPECPLTATSGRRTTESLRNERRSPGGGVGPGGRVDSQGLIVRGISHRSYDRWNWMCFTFVPLAVWFLDMLKDRVKICADGAEGRLTC